MMTDIKWPGWPELPLLLLFMLVVMLVFFLLLVTADEGGTHGQSGLKTARARFLEGRVVAPNRSAEG